MIVIVIVMMMMFYQDAITVALNHENIGKYLQRITK